MSEWKTLKKKPKPRKPKAIFVTLQNRLSGETREVIVRFNPDIVNKKKIQEVKRVLRYCQQFIAWAEAKK